MVGTRPSWKKRQKRYEKLLAMIISEPDPSVSSSLAEVRRLAADVQKNNDRLDILINNAGIGFGDPTSSQRELSQDGYELRFSVNYLAPFLLTNLLLTLHS